MDGWPLNTFHIINGVLRKPDVGGRHKEKSNAFSSNLCLRMRGGAREEKALGTCTWTNLSSTRNDSGYRTGNMHSEVRLSPSSA